MFDHAQLDQVLDLQQRSYKLLRWMQNAMDRDFITPASTHKYISETRAARSWIEEHYENIPHHALPEKEDMEPFINLFTSFLTSSFDLEENPGKRHFSPDAHCFCPMCSWMVKIPNLQPKKLTKANKRRADQLKVRYMEELCLDQALDESNNVQIVEAEENREKIAIATYASHLFLRMRGQTEGPALLALWRTFAWKPEGSPKPKFKLEAKDVLAAEASLIEQIHSLTT